MAGGYIKVWRKMQDSAVMQDAWLCQLWLWCLFQAEWRSVTGLRRGVFTTGRNTASGQLKVSPSKWYRGIEKLRDIGCINVEADGSRTKITICNYETYQDRDEKIDAQQGVNNDRTANEQRADSKVNSKKTAQVTQNERGYEEQALNSEQGAKNDPLTENDEIEQRTSIDKKEELITKKIPGPEKSANDLGDSPDASCELSPAWLAVRWCFQRRGNKGRDELEKARTTFEEMIRLGCKPAQIAAEIDNPERRRTEPIWDFEKRMNGDRDGKRNRDDRRPGTTHGDFDPTKHPPDGASGAADT